MDEDSRTLHGLDFGFLSSFFHEKLFFPKFELLNSGCGLCASAAYLRVFTVHIMTSDVINQQWAVNDCMWLLLVTNTILPFMLKECETLATCKEALSESPRSLQTIILLKAGMNLIQCAH